MNRKRYMIRLDDDIVSYIESKNKNKSSYAETIRALIRNGIAYNDLILKITSQSKKES